MLWTAPPPAHECHGCGCCPWSSANSLARRISCGSANSTGPFTDREVGSDLRAVLSGPGVNGLKENSVCFEHIWIGKMFDLREKVMASVNRAPSEIMQFPIRKPYLICWTIEFAEHSFLPTERIGAANRGKTAVVNQ
jgi:hypothetical protein